MNIVTKLRNEFSFVRGNYLILIIGWILMDFAGEMPALYYGPFVMYDLGATASILGFIGFVSILALAAVQFPGGYLVTDMEEMAHFHPHVRSCTLFHFPYCCT